MDRKVVLIVIILVFFIAYSNSAPACTSYNKAPHGHSKSTVAGSNTIWVPDNYTKIQWAINNATAGDTIFVRAGTYYEHVVVDKALTLVGENKHNTIIDGNGTGTVVHVNRVNNVTISGFTLQHGELGIWSWYSTGNVFSDNVASNNSYGIFLGYSGNSLLSGNTISGNQYGIYLSYSSNNTFTGNTVSNKMDGIYLWSSSNNTFTGNTISNNWDGVYLSYSSNNTFTDNTASNNEYSIYIYYSIGNVFSDNVASNNSYGIYHWRSSKNVLSGNIVSSNNQYGIYLSYSQDNDLSGNTATYNQYGIYLDDSFYNVLCGNIVSSNNRDGILLYHSINNVLSGNIALNNQYGVHVSDSDTNVLSGNIASNNQYGVHVSYSRDNVVTGNNITNNSQYGISFTSSLDNEIFHNNFINNTEPPSSTDSVNSWDNGSEGNYWSDYDGADANRDGIGDKPYPIDENSQDSCPLMAMFLQFNIANGNQSYNINAVCNSTISNFQYHYDSNNRANAVSFKVNGTEGTGFCRICVPHTLIEPPYRVTVDHKSPLDFKTVYTNGTHTWLYFTYYHPGNEVTIRHTLYSEQLLLSQWAIFGLIVIIIILLSISIHYYRRFNEQRKVIQAYERELGSFPVTHSERARTRFIEDVIERKEKIENFKRKYRIKIQPADTLENLMEKLGVQKEKKDKVKH